MEVIDCEELKAKLDRGDDFRLVMAMEERTFRAMRIPGSILYGTIDEFLEQCGPDEEIVVYCSDAACAHSRLAYRALEEHGYNNVRRYSGGLSEWREAGYSLEGEAI